MKQNFCTQCGMPIGFEGICYGCRQHQTREAYRALTEAETAAKVEAIIAAMGEDFYKEPENDDFFGLLANKGISTERIAAAALGAEVYYPCEIYRDASKEVRRKLIELLMKPDCQYANEILQCLAIAGGDDVRAAFVALEKNTPRTPGHWLKFLHAPPSVYATAGGWSFDEAGNRIELNYAPCYPVFPVSGCTFDREGNRIELKFPVREGVADSGLRVSTPREETCPHCGTQLVDLLTLDGRDDRLAFLGFSGLVKIPCCPLCVTMCERTLVRYTPDGDSTLELIDPYWDGKKMSEREFTEITSRRFVLSSQPEPLFFARSRHAEGIITLGGFADWIQDFQYDTCPDCGKTLRYFASVPLDALTSCAEGTLYLEICPDCQLIHIFHQQT